MKRIAILIAVFGLIFFSSEELMGKSSTNPYTSTNTFTVEDSFGIVKRYYVNETFLNDFARFARNVVPDKYRIWMSDIYRALQDGASITYNRDQNTISGMWGRWHVDGEKLSTNYLNGRSRARQRWDATANSIQYQFCEALEYLQFIPTNIIQ